MHFLKKHVYFSSPCSESPENCLVLSDFIRHGKKALRGSRRKVLQIARVRFTSLCDWWNDIPNCLERNQILKELKLLDCPLGKENAELLFQGVAANNYLERLSLNGTSLGDDVITSITDLLRTNTALKALSLSRNCLTDKAAVQIAGALNLNASLTSLDLTENAITESGSDALRHEIILRKSMCSFKPFIWILRGKHICVIALILRSIYCNIAIEFCRNHLPALAASCKKRLMGFFVH